MQKRYLVDLLAVNYGMYPSVSDCQQAEDVVWVRVRVVVWGVGEGGGGLGE